LDQQAEATTSEPAAIPQPTSNDDHRDLFRFVKQNARTETTTQLVHSINQEIQAYLCSPNTSTSSLLQYPHLVHSFLKYNAALPSGAAVERL